MLRLLSLLQSKPSWGGAELAARLEVTPRTVRRDVDRLRLLGYPVEALPGRYGGYQLGRGGHMPPLLLSDDEAVAVALGLRSAIDGSISGLEESAESTLSKLEQILPARLASRVRALHESTASMLYGGERPTVDAAHLVTLAGACSARERVRFAYTDKGGRPSERLVEPIGLVRSGARWYLVARDVDRKDWRTFRIDRMATLEAVGTPFQIDDRPDPVALVAEGIALGSYPFRARVRIPLPVEEAMRVIPRTFAVLEGEDGTTVADIGSASLERMVGYLAGLNPPCEVLDPPELRRALLLHARSVQAANSPKREVSRRGRTRRS
jgi:predicted DNA-binding transcriptional regulator YafY